MSFISPESVLRCLLAMFSLAIAEAQIVSDAAESWHIGGIELTNDRARLDLFDSQILDDHLTYYSTQLPFYLQSDHLASSVRTSSAAPEAKIRPRSSIPFGDHHHWSRAMEQDVHSNDQQATLAELFVCEDSDGDGVLNSNDLDDDNDGILDSLECYVAFRQEYIYTGADQISVIPVGATRVQAKIWGAGGRGDQQSGRGVGGSGGYTQISIPLCSLPGGTTQLIVTVGQGGNSSTGALSYGNGGTGFINPPASDRPGRNCGSGGGMSALSIITLTDPSMVTNPEILAIAGGGGTMSAFSDPGVNAGEGGGNVGGDYSLYPAFGGQGGSQVSGGATNTNGNTGSYLLGADAVENGGGGGGGFYGGGSGNYSGPGGSEHGAGGGSGYLNPLMTSGTLITGNVQVPPRVSDSDYIVGVGVGGNNGGGNGGNGLVILTYVSETLCDSDNDGVPDSIDLDSDNDGVFDLTEAGHGGLDIDSDGVLDGLSSAFGTNGMFDGLETSVDSGMLNYTVADSDSDGDFDTVELDSDNDGCFDVVEAGYSDPDGNGLLGTGN